MSNRFLDYQGLLLIVKLRNTLHGDERGLSFSRLQSEIFCSMNSLIAPGASVPRFFLGAVPLHMVYFAASHARSSYLSVLVYVIGALPLCKEDIQGDGEGSDRSITGVKISSGQ